ncbi:uncharacterized protein Dwil_GK11298 [Drosophila willistoni]|uniref:Trichoplein keratin filament-binding protein n=1 Tax=Drosophila willistoni TaxID=7260 RepID=B4NAW6_DROWI|nr:trichoplein keratin filament-binding protein [Drosophila willistoni]XP_023034444.1 trichoplein keratin filament-binding protein [Drosophila willistoni]XP_023034445.1 trichoplein keratin filament-binding protein [Drosophila willistoni]EDW80930.1 uncharacterized protein Dwil_GK11298 [Drosophila willistoni]
MSARLNQQHLAYAHRREQENSRVQATQEVNRYYNHWGKVTSRFDNWTNKEYYEKAGKKLQTQKEQQEKEVELNERRAKLRHLLDMENEVYDSELGRKRKTREKAAEDLQLLGRVNQSLKEQEQLKRKLEMEAKLYGRWRHGVDDEELLYKSKSNNEVLAKLNWLDKQIENQQQKEQQEALAAERQMQLHKDMLRIEQTHKERQLIREQEIKELRSLQETHMTELKERQQEADKLKMEEQQFRIFLGELNKEKQLLEESTAVVLQEPDISNAFNLKKIKVFIRQRSDTNRKQITLCINLLERMSKYVAKIEDLESLLAKCKKQLEEEALASSQIDAMYESEAKYNLQRCEDNWREQHLERYSTLSKLIDQEHQCLSGLLQENIAQQQVLVELRSTHLAGIEQANKHLEQLSKEQAMPDPELLAETTSQQMASETEISATSSSSSLDLPAKVADSFSNLNLDVWESLPPVRGGIDSPRLSKTRSMNVVNSETAVPPKFARKRVAWT